jgi:inner membrane protein
MKESMLKNSLGLRLAIIAFLSLLLLIPAQMIKSLIKERQERREEAVNEVFSKWGKEQVIGGPILTIPYQTKMKTAEGELIEVKKWIHLLPENLLINGIVTPESQYRGIYEMVLYQADIQISGYFKSSELIGMNISQDRILWNETALSLGISDMKGIKEMVEVRWIEEIYPFGPGVLMSNILPGGVGVRIPFHPDQDKYQFDLHLRVGGSENLQFTPVGKETKVSISSIWNNPSFTGEFLPERREIKEDGFKAEWKVLYMNRNYPQKWIGDEYAIEPSKFGVSFILPVDEYQKTMRTVKYALMFIAFTFLTVFLIELLDGKAVHPIQYLLIGFALLIFYSLLLALSEHLRFNLAYLVAVFATISLISGYTGAVLKSNRQAFLIFGFLFILYGYLYLVLQLQDYALLMGSLILFVILALVMFLTRRIDWFSILKQSDTGKLKEPSTG